MNKLLYFPYISIPKSKWLVQTLLYWDEVASIVPFEFTSRPDRLDKHMQILINEQLVTQIFPEDYVSELPDFTENFLRYVDSDPIIKNRSSLVKNNGIITNTNKIHVGKLSDISYQLVERGLAKKEGNWLKVESYTAESFMTYLAILIGQKTGFVPSTDRYSGLSKLLIPEGKVDKLSIKNRISDEFRAEILERIMPVPRYVGDISDILRFKHKYYNELKRFRGFIESFLIDIEIINDEELREVRVNRFLEEAKEEIEYLKEKMSFFGGVNIDFVTLCSLSSIIYPIASGIQDDNIIEVMGAAPGLLGAIYSTIFSSNIGELRRKPLAYAAILSSNNRLLGKNNYI